MSEHPHGDTELVYQLEDRPQPAVALYAGLQHVLASFVGIITPTLIIGGVLGLGDYLPYLISMALMVSGVGTFIQARRFGPVGAGMICVQGTSFAFLSTILAAGLLVKGNGGTPEQVMAMLFGLCLVGALVEIVISQFIGKLRRVITPLVTGVVVTTIGVSLIKVGMTDLAGGFNSPTLGHWQNLLVGGTVLITVIAFNRSKHPMLRISSILIGILTGYLLASAMGMVSLEGKLNQPLISVPIPFRFGFDFDWGLFVPVALIYAITAIETAGDITANCMVTKQPVEGESYLQRVKRGILGDGINSMLAAVFTTFPNTTFSQNNSVIQITGIASRYIGYYIALILVLLGLFPIVGALLSTIPKPVIGGATLVMFGTVAAAGIKIIAQERLDRHKLMIMAVSFGTGLGVMMVPEVLKQAPAIVQSIFSSPVTTSGITAVVMTLLFTPAPAKQERAAMAQAEAN
ncbi:uracil-xanthine permease family protein [Aliagarivorans taiwanensis]|uniref:uracil-xanthine permease family protein n=1 Tax=Aliagarivorans taiwanensis TaxID=561966 RepID=UPI0003FBE726|nr:nucleobase:cation symporter-2 family protein [Aliagarivorans taiwanensis]